MQPLRILILFVLSFLVFLEAKCQTNLFSQTFESPINLNPAFTGYFEEDWRFISNFRSQGQHFGNAINTINGSFDKNMKFENGQLGAGILLNRNYSNGIYVPASEFYVSISSLIKIASTNNLGMGIQIGYVNKNLSYQNLTFPEQYDRSIGGFSNNLPLSENFKYSNSSYIDLNAGLIWSLIKEKQEVLIGSSVQHLNQPTDNFIDENNRLTMKYNIHSIYKYKLLKNQFLSPQVSYSLRSNASELLIGTQYGKRLTANKSNFKNISLGVYTRNIFDQNIQSMILLFGFGYLNWITYISYDIDVSGLKSTKTYKNAIEFTLIYKRPIAKLKKLTIPCIKY